MPAHMAFTELRNREITGQLGTGTNLSGYPTNQELMSLLVTINGALRQSHHGNRMMGETEVQIGNSG